MNAYSSRVVALVATALTYTCVGFSANATDNIDTLSEVVITASPIAHDADHFATIVGIVDRSEILERGGASLADALTSTPGVTGTGFAAGASRPVIRGFDANRVRMLENGIGSFDASDVGPDHGVPIDPLSAQRIEVVRGAATLRYGSQAIGGVVNVINNRVPSELPQRPLAGELSGGLSSNANAADGSVLMDGRAGQFGIHVDGFARHTSDYDIPGGTQPNSFFKGGGYSAGSSYFFGDNHVGAGIVHYDAEYGIPSDDTYIDMQQTKGMLRSSFDFGSEAFQKLNVDAGVADYEHKEREPDGTALSTFKDKEWDARAEGVFGATGILSGSAVGVQLQNRDFSALGEGADYLLPTRTRTTAVFGFAEAPLGKRAHLEAGTRIERVTIDGTPTSGLPVTREFTPVSASLGINFDANEKLTLGLMFASAARAPGQTELFARGPHDGPGTFETGDSTLRIERANSLEGSLRLRLTGLRLDGSLWVAKFDNYIYGDVTGSTCDEDGVCVPDDSGPLKEMNYRQATATFRGAEIKATFPVADLKAGTLNAEIMGDSVRATFANGAGNVPFIPPYHLSAGLRWNGERLSSGLFAKYSAKQDQITAAETPTAGYTSVNAYINWRARQGGLPIDLTLAGHNLTNSEQRNPVAINKDSVILPGRDVRLVLRASF